MNELTIEGSNLIIKHENEQLRDFIEENINHFKSFDNYLYDTAINCHNGKALNLLLQYNINESYKIVNSPNFNTSNLTNLLKNDFKISLPFLIELIDTNKNNVTEFLSIIFQFINLNSYEYQVLFDKSIQKNKLRVSCFLMKYNSGYARLTSYRYLTPKKLKSIMNLGFVVTVTMAITTLYQNNALEYIKVIIENSIHFNNDTIIKFLYHYRNNKPMSDTMLVKIVFTEKTKLKNILYGENINGETVLKVAFNKLVDELYTETIPFNNRLSVENNINYKSWNPKINDYIAIIKILIEHGADMYVTNKNRETLMTVALNYRIEPLIKYLVKCGIDINRYNERGETPFYTVCRNEIECTKRNIIRKRKGTIQYNNLKKNYPIESISIINYLVGYGVNINKCNYEGLSPLHLACIHNNESLVEYLVELGANVNIKDNHNETPLIKACQTPNESLIKYLVEYGADVNAKDISDETPLIKLCKTANKPIIKYLVEHGADVNAKNISGETPLINACQIENESVIKYLVKHGADLNVKNRMGENPLEIAIRYENKSVIKYLVERDIIIDISEKSMEYLLMVACEYGYKTIIEQLIERGVDVNKHNDNYTISVNKLTKLKGFCPLTIACRTGNTSIINYLIKNGANVHGCSDCIDTPLTAACAHNDKSLIVYLVLKGANINQCNKYGNTPLIIACQNNCESIVQYLIEKGANVNAFDNDKLNPLIIACQQGNESIVQYLVKRGANVNQYDSRGNPLLFIAGE